MTGEGGEGGGLVDPRAVTLTDDTGGEGFLIRFPSCLEERYEPRRALGAGGMGAVFEAFDRDLERLVAVKVTRPVGSPEYFRRFQREAEILASLDHPNLVRVFAHGETDLCPYMVMECLEGESLAAVIGNLENLDPMLQVASALEAVHGAGLVHRDVKPGNVVLTPEGRAVLVDFGVALDPSRSRITAVGMAIGTEGFVPPEVYLGEEAGPPADWYAWGATLHLLGEGRLAYRGEDIQASLEVEDFPPPRFERVRPDSSTAELIRRCLAWDPRHRLSSYSEVRTVLGIEGAVTSRPAAAPGPLAVSGAGQPGRRVRQAPTYPGLDPPVGGRTGRLLLLVAALALLALLVLWLRPDLASWLTR